MRSAVDAFVHDSLPARVVFGNGAIERVPEELVALGCARVLVIAGGSAAAAGERVLAALGARAAGRFGEVVQHVPEALAVAAGTAAKEVAADGLCSIGGGSATGLAKAVAVDLDLPIVAVPTTYAGSEATPIYGVTGERKRTDSSPRALPRTVVYDPELTRGLPVRVTATSGFNALAHALAALCSPGHDALAALSAAEAARTIAGTLPAAVRAPDDLDARGRLLLAAHLAGSALAATGTGLHHRLCHLLGGRYALEHALLHAVLLPHTVAWDEALTAPGRRRAAEALGADDAAEGLRLLARDVGVPAGLGAIGFPGDAIDDVSREAAEAVDGLHPRAGDVSWFRELLVHAHGGRPPYAPVSRASEPPNRRNEA